MMLVNKQLSIYRVRLPLPFRLNHVNCYAIKGSEGWTLIDAGLNTEASRKAWQQFMAEHHINQSDIRGIYLTHSHPDHIGAAGWLQELCGAPVYVSKAEADAINRVWRGFDQEAAEGLTGFLTSHGMSLDLANHSLTDLEQMAAVTTPHPVLSMIEAGTSVRLGDYQYSTVVTPGHAKGHMCFFNQEFGILFSGDHLLAKITSNISIWPSGDPDPLKSYLHSLDSNRSLPCQTVLPAHGPAFENMEQRISELEAHHKERLDLMKASAAGGASAFEVCRRVFNGSLSEHELWFATTETLAHLMHLMYKGELAVTESNGVNIFGSI